MESRLRSIAKAGISVLVPRLSAALDSIGMDSETKRKVKIRLAELASEESVKEMEAEIALRGLAVEDRKSAREMAQVTRDWFPKAMAAAILVFMVGLMVFDRFMPTDTGLSVEHIVMAMLGYLARVFTFYFGGNAHKEAHERINAYKKLKNGH